MFLQGWQGFAGKFFEFRVGQIFGRQLEFSHRLGVIAEHVAQIHLIKLCAGERSQLFDVQIIRQIG